MIYKLYIGSNNTTHNVEVKKAIIILSKSFYGFTILKSSGCWKGKIEKSIIVEIETSKKKLVYQTTKKLCYHLHQQAIGLVVKDKMNFIYHE